MKYFIYSVEKETFFFIRNEDNKEAVMDEKFVYYFTIEKLISNFLKGHEWRPIKHKDIDKTKIFITEFTENTIEDDLAEYLI